MLLLKLEASQNGSLGKFCLSGRGLVRGEVKKQQIKPARH